MQDTNIIQNKYEIQMCKCVNTNTNTNIILMYYIRVLIYSYIYEGMNARLLQTISPIFLFNPRPDGPLDFPPPAGEGGGGRLNTPVYVGSCAS